MSNIIDSIQLSGVTYSIQGSGGGSPTVELTQAEYDALVSAGTVAEDTYYIITDAQAGDLTQYWTSAQTQSAITQATSGKVDSSSVVSSVTSASTNSEIPTAKAVWDVASQGGGGGGKAISAGTNISVTTGETADTISCTLPISAGTGTNSLIVGYNSSDSFWKPTASGIYSIAHGTKCTASGDTSIATGYYNEARANYSIAQGYHTSTYGGSSHSEGWDSVTRASYSHAEGNNCTTSGESSHAEGIFTNTSNKGEHSEGWYNVTRKNSTTFGDSGNTLFSVGNGTAENARHNAFEIRQNGDMYLNNGTSDIKLQDYLQIKVVKLTQQEYDALSPNYDNNTLYVIT